MGGLLIFVGLVGLVLSLVALARRRLQWARITTRKTAGLAAVASFAVMMTGAALSPQPTTSSRESLDAAASPPAQPAAVSPSPTPTTVPTTAAPAPPAPAPTSARPAPVAHAVAASGALLPDRRHTPGHSFRGVTSSQVCVPGYSASVRDVSESTRRAVFAEYGVAWSKRSRYEVDHLIPLELGGDNSLKNLWPEPQDGSRAGYATKDSTENHLHDLVCARRLSLSTAQHAIASNWYAAYQRYAGMPVVKPAPRVTHTPRPQPQPTHTTPAPAPVTVVHPGAFCAPEGARGVTNRGTPMVCKTTATDPRARWRHA